MLDAMIPPQLTDRYKQVANACLYRLTGHRPMQMADQLAAISEQLRVISLTDLDSLEERLIAALFDSVYVSFYKDMGGVAGCVLAGPADFIDSARTWITSRT